MNSTNPVDSEITIRNLAPVPPLPPATAPSEDRGHVGDLSEQLRLLRDQVDILQVQVGEKRTSWWRQPSLIVSILALVVSIALAIYSQLDQTTARQEEDLKGKLETLRRNTIRLVEIRQEFERIMRSNASLDEKNTGSILANTQRQLLLEDTKAILDEVQERASSGALAYLGYELQLSSQFEAAESYYLKAQRVATKANRLPVLRALAMLYMQPGTPVHDLERGRRHWREALEALGDNRDDYSQFQRGEVHLNWAASELYNGDRKRAEACLSRAREEFEKLNPLLPLRGYALNILHSFRKNQENPQQQAVGNEVQYPVQGEWKIRYTGGSPLKGTAVFIQNGANQGFTAQLELFEAGQLVQKSTGMGSVVSPGVLRIDWQGVRFNNMAPPMNLLGSTTLRWSEARQVYSGEERLLGGGTTQVFFRR